MKDISNRSNKLERGLEWLLFLMAFSIPFSYAFNSIITGILFLYSFLWFSRKNDSFLNKKTQTFYIFILFFIIQIIGVLYANQTNTAIKSVIRNIPFLLFPITFLNLSEVIDKKKIKMAIYGLLVGVVIILLSAQSSILIKIISENESFNKLFFSYIRGPFIEQAIVSIHSPYFGLLAVFSLISSARLMFLNNISANRFFKGMLMLYLSFSLYEISAFMSIFLLFLFFIVHIIIIVKTRKKKDYLLLIFMTIALFSITFSFEDSSYEQRGAETIFNRLTTIINKGDEVRKENWESVMLTIKDHIIIGVGSDGGLKFLQQYRNINSEPFINKHNAHNQYLEIFLRYGIIGLSIYLLLVFKLIKQAFLSKNYFFRWFMVIFLLSSITESLLQRQIGIVFFTFFSTLFLVYKDKNPKFVKN